MTSYGDLDFLRAGISIQVVLPPHHPLERKCDDCGRVIPDTQERVAITKVVWRRHGNTPQNSSVRTEFIINLHVLCASQIGDYIRTRTHKRIAKATNPEQLLPPNTPSTNTIALDGLAKLQQAPTRGRKTNAKTKDASTTTTET